MKDNIEILNYLIASETKSIEKMLRLNKEDELTILRLQNKLKALEEDIKEHKELTKEYRNHLRNLTEKTTHIGTKSNPIRKSHPDTPDKSASIAQVRSVGKLDK